MVLIDGPATFNMGSPPSEPERNSQEFFHRRLISHRFAIASKEVTIEEFQRYAQAVLKAPHKYNKRYSPVPEGPQISVSWFDVIDYCNWLSDKEGLPRCYEPNQEGKYAEGMRVNAEAVAKGGYRLPTEAEWEYACRAGTVTSRYYGNTPDLLGLYEWYIRTSENQAQPCGMRLPNDLGLFDMLGNVYEWCHDCYTHSSPGPGSTVREVIRDEIVSQEARLFRGATFVSPAAALRSSIRILRPPSELRPDLGFRVARTM
jgi:formylglycine-generating enzyme required for sulfatase activity